MWGCFDCLDVGCQVNSKTQTKFDPDRDERFKEVTVLTESTERQIDFMEKGQEKAVYSGMFSQAAAYEQQAKEMKLKLRKLKLEKAEISRHNNLLEKKKSYRRRCRRGKDRQHGTEKCSESETSAKVYEYPAEGWDW